MSRLTAEAAAAIAAGQATGLPPVRYASDAWHALSVSDPRRVAAVWRGAEAWRDHCDEHTVASDLLAEMAECDAELSRRVREGSWDVGSAGQWAAVARSLGRLDTARQLRAES